MHFQHPIKCVQRFQCANAGGRELLAASAGPGIYIFDVTTGSKLFSWPEKSDIATPVTAYPSKSTTTQEADFEPPEKRRKLSASQSVKPEPDKTAGATIPKSAGLQLTSVPILVVTKTGNHIVAVTAEDKFLRVFEVSPNGSLSQLSERSV